MRAFWAGANGRQNCADGSYSQSQTGRAEEGAGAAEEAAAGAAEADRLLRPWCRQTRRGLCQQ
jgi:hypothetical protein